ncbi:hypothetical protein LIER_37039 [Lithospermum erythrorhizon]|uniref:Uncharacterized protein n=1 Tax=Lithospermum erythrorhizon TaxID=34254 RepID=A0AAV3PE16_LITER
MLGNLDVNALRRVLQEHGTAPSLPLSSYPVNAHFQNHVSSSSSERNQVTWSESNPEMEQWMKRVRENGDRALVETQEEQSVFPSPQYETFIRDLGPGFVLSKRYGEDLKNLDLAPDQITGLLSCCPPESPKYMYIVNLAPETRRKTLLRLLDELYDLVKSSSSSSIKRKKSTRYEMIVLATTTTI